MRAERIVVIDAGTSALRAVSVTREGGVRVLASREWPLFVPGDGGPFAREIDAGWLDDALSALCRAGAAEDVAGVAVTGQREGLVFAAADGAALLVSPNVDARAAAEGIAIDAAHASDVYAETGHLPSLMQAAAKWRWLQEHRPAAAEAVATVIPLADWIGWRLCGGSPAMTRTLGVENGMLDLTSGKVADRAVARGGLDAGRVPSCVADGEVRGEVAGGALGGLPVVLAGADTQCALVGMGVARAGECGVAAGWSAPVQLVTGVPVLDPEMRTWCGAHALGSCWVAESNAGDLGRAFGWVCGLVGVSPDDAADLAAAAPPGSGDVLAIVGPRVMHAARMNAGVGGLTFPLPFAVSAPARGAVLRAFLESAACGVRANVEQLESVAGARVGRVALGGGMSRSALFARMLADVLDRPVTVAASPETSALGAAALAFAAIGLHPSLRAALAEMARPRETVEPRARDSAAYDDVYARWRAMAEEFERMALI
ncbi:MAG TPA: FGGY-family carbohydrate kinase [Dehalococcoidia bacterium]|nr:FGGY-family carbohydrate kinase [Dehalococcoidia bacterium]